LDKKLNFDEHIVDIINNHLQRNSLKLVNIDKEFEFPDTELKTRNALTGLS